MRDWLLLLAPVFVVGYFLINPGQLSELMTWAMRAVT
jgi:hypothetical protein